MPPRHSRAPASSARRRSLTEPNDSRGARPSSAPRSPSAVAARSALEQTLASAEAAHQHTQEHLAAELVIAAERLSDVARRLAHETATRSALELNPGECGSGATGRGRAACAGAAAAAARVADLQARYDDAGAQAASAREALERQLNDAVAGLDDSRQLRASEAAAAAERLTHREAEFGAILAEAAAARSTFELNLVRRGGGATGSGRAACVGTGGSGSARRRSAGRDTPTRRRRRRAHSEALEQHLNDAIAGHDDSQAESVGGRCCAERLDTPPAEPATLAEAAAARSALEQTMAEAEAAHQLAVESRAATELLAAAVRQATTRGQTCNGKRPHVRRWSARWLKRASSLRAFGDASSRSCPTSADAPASSRRGSKDSSARSASNEHSSSLGKGEAIRRSSSSTTRRFSNRSARHVDELQRLRDTRTQSGRATNAPDWPAHPSFSGCRPDTARLARRSMASAPPWRPWRVVSSQHVAERARLERVLAERDAEISAQAASRVAAEHASEEAAAQARESSGRRSTSAAATSASSSASSTRFARSSTPPEPARGAANRGRPGAGPAEAPRS